MKHGNGEESLGELCQERRWRCSFKSAASFTPHLSALSSHTIFLPGTISPVSHIIGHTNQCVKAVSTVGKARLIRITNAKPTSTNSLLLLDDHTMVLLVTGHSPLRHPPYFSDTGLCALAGCNNSDQLLRPRSPDDGLRIPHDHVVRSICHVC